jgi:hypothetical protein
MMFKSLTFFTACWVSAWLLMPVAWRRTRTSISAGQGLVSRFRCSRWVYRRGAVGVGFDLFVCGFEIVSLKRPVFRDWQQRGQVRENFGM